MIRLALFDIDGTLLRTGGAGVKAFDRTFAMEFRVYQATRNVDFAGRTDSSLLRECFALHRIDPIPENFRRFYDTYVFLLQYLLQHSEGVVCRGVVKFIQALKALPEPPVVGLLTGNIRLGAEIKLRHYSLWDHFHSGAFGDDHEDRNQLAVIAHERGRALLGQSISGDETLVVGDTPHDVACAKAIGARMLAVGTGGYSRDQLRACNPTWVVDHLEDFEVAEVCRRGVRSTSV